MTPLEKIVAGHYCSEVYERELRILGEAFEVYGVTLVEQSFQDVADGSLELVRVTCQYCNRKFRLDIRYGKDHWAYISIESSGYGLGYIWWGGDLKLDLLSLVVGNREYSAGLYPNIAEGRKVRHLVYDELIPEDI